MLHIISMTFYVRYNIIFHFRFLFRRECVAMKTTDERSSVCVRIQNETLISVVVQLHNIVITRST